MKKHIVLFPILIVFALFLSSCEGSLNNTFTFRNQTESKLLINFRANAIEVPAGETIRLKDIPKGTFSFTTIITELPGGATSATLQGDVDGNVIFNQSTRVLVLYTGSVVDGAFVLVASLSTSEDLTVDEGPTEP